MLFLRYFIWSRVQFRFHSVKLISRETIRSVEEFSCGEALGAERGRELEPDTWPGNAAASRAEGMKGSLDCVYHFLEHFEGYTLSTSISNHTEQNLHPRLLCWKDICLENWHEADLMVKIHATLLFQLQFWLHISNSKGFFFWKQISTSYNCYCIL